MIEPFKEPLHLAKLSATATDAQLGERFGVTGRTIGWWRAKFGIPPAPLSVRAARRRKTSLDTRFFSTIDTETKAYFLGFLAADGYVHRSGRWFGCTVALRDVHILEDMRAALGSTAEIRDKCDNSGSWPRTPQKLIAFSSVEMVADLARYGVVPAKSLTIALPSLSPGLERHLIRGVFDGDGSIGKRQFCLTGSAAMLDGVTRTIERHTGRTLSSCPFVSGHPRLIGNRRDEDVLHWLYNKASFYLRRKHDVYMAHWF